MIDFLLSEESQRYFAEETFEIPAGRRRAACRRRAHPRRRHRARPRSQPARRPGRHPCPPDRARDRLTARLAPRAAVAAASPAAVGPGRRRGGRHRPAAARLPAGPIVGDRARPRRWRWPPAPGPGASSGAPVSSPPPSPSPPWPSPCRWRGSPSAPTSPCAASGWWPRRLPLAIPTYVGGYAFIGALGPRGILQGWLEPFGVESLPSFYGFWGAWMVLTLFTYPYVLLTVRAGGAWARPEPRGGQSHPWPGSVDHPAAHRAPAAATVDRGGRRCWWRSTRCPTSAPCRCSASTASPGPSSCSTAPRSIARPRPCSGWCWWR